jgi:hypothetical protein
MRGSYFGSGIREATGDKSSVGAKAPLRLAVLLFVIALTASTGQRSFAASDTAWGFTPFPYDFTLEAVNRTYKVIEDDATLFAIHRDNGIPWQEALEDKPFPKKVTEEWQARVGHIKAHHKVYVGLAPLAHDRVSLHSIAEGSKTPKSFLNKALNSNEVKTAYLNYARRAVDTFNPDYLNLGIEVGELMTRNKKRWAQFEELFEYVKNGIEKDHPNIQIGISFGLQALMEPGAIRSAQRIIADSDYVGISFYPHMSKFHEAIGSSALPPPPNQWLEPLNWLRKNVDKPIAICETGYTTRPVRLNNPKMVMDGSEDLQKRYLQDLAGLAARDNYLFVAWFLPIDYKALSERANFAEGSVNRLWEYIGLFGPDLKPKPAWPIWKQIVSGQVKAAPPHDTVSTITPEVVAVTPETTGTRMSTQGAAVYRFDMSNVSSTFKGSEYDKIKVADVSPSSGQSMSWSYRYGKRFQYAVSTIERGTLAGGIAMKLSVKGDQNSFILVSFEEKSGEAYWTVVPITQTWSVVDLPFNEFQRDQEKKRKDGQFQPEDVISVTIADATGFEGAEGDQNIWLADWIIY